MSQPSAMKGPLKNLHFLHFLITLYFSNFYILKKYQMIEPLDALEELNEGTRILIYPCINLLLMREDIKKLLAVFGEEAGQDVAVTEEISAADETAAEEEGETGNGEL